MSRKVLGWNINQRSGLGKEIPEFVLQELLEQDADVIVLREGELLEQAVAWCRIVCGLTFDAVNDNIEATKTFFGGNSRKICCDYYIDDKGCTPDIFYSYWDKKMNN